MPLDPDDPLVPMPDAELWMDPAAHGGDLNLAAQQVADFVSFNSLIWPAADPDGHLVPPPAEHILDHLVHSQALLPEDETLHRDPVDTVVVTSRQYGCDWCTEVARYDGYFMNGQERTRSFMCGTCLVRGSSGQLGSGQNRYLMSPDEVPPEVREVCEELFRRVGRPSIWAEA